MEEQFKNEDRILRKLVSEAGLEQPGPDFTTRLMEQIEQRASEKVLYTPLISRKGWWVLSITAVVVLSLIILFPVDSTVTNFELPMDKIGTLIPEFRISKTMLYGMIFLSLFLFQVPLLKRYIEPR